ncbi:DUF6366 family protein [Macrococcus sp. EM39E]|uniref:DUF6366 family protein n=1 Tax=Macrococcus animalis TaxID=3395467 RepID=UPI0039BDDF12
MLNNQSDKERLSNQETAHNPLSNIHDAHQNANTSGVFGGMNNKFIGLLILILMTFGLIGYFLLN